MSTGYASRRSTRRWSFGTAGIRTPILVLYPPPPGWACELARAEIAVAAGDAGALADAHRRGLPIAGPVHSRCPSSSRSRPGSAAAGSSADRDLVAAARLVAAFRRRRGSPGFGRTSRPSRTPAVTTDQLARFEAAVAALAAAGIRLPPRHAAASAALIAAGVVSYDGVRPGLALYGIVPDELGPTRSTRNATDRRPRRFGRSWRSTPARSASRSSPRAGASAMDRPSGRPGPAGSPRCPSATATAGRERSRTGRRRSSVATCVPLVGNVAMDAVMADVTDVPGRPVDHTDEFVLMGQDGGERITALDLAQARTTNTWEVLTGMARRLPRVYHAAAGPVGRADPYRGEGLGWRPSSSGTATSAIWRSTRS